MEKGDYMSVRELSEDQLEQLRVNMYYADEDDFEEEEEELMVKCFQAELFSDITDEMIFEHYGHISFVNDDFGCSMGED